MKILIVSFLFLLSSCGSMFTHKADQSKVKLIDGLVNKIAFKKLKSVRSSNKMLVRLKRGQWVASVSTDKKSGEKSLMIRKVVRLKKGFVTIETETYSSSNKNPLSPMVIQQVIKGYPKRFAVNGKMSFSKLLSKFEIVSMKMKDGNGEVQDMSAAGSSPLVKMGLTGVGGQIELGKVTRKSCHTKYLKSSRCYYVPFKIGVMGFNISGTTVQNSRIPIVGYLNSDSEQLSEVVIAYGFQGRKVIIK